MNAILGQFLKIQVEQNDQLKTIATEEDMRKVHEATVRYALNQERLKQLYQQLFAAVL
jgi:hypothetical protein